MAREAHDLAQLKIHNPRRNMWYIHVECCLNFKMDIDQHTGPVLEALEESGQEADTIIIFASVHRAMGGSHHLCQEGSIGFRETVNDPLIIVDLRLTGGARTAAIGTHLDLVPTILAMGDYQGKKREDDTFL